MRELTISIPEQVDEDKIKMLIAASLYENDLIHSENWLEFLGEHFWRKWVNIKYLSLPKKQKT